VIKAGIIGCGTIADSHAEQIVKIPGCSLVGVCDTEPLMAKQMAERFNAKGWFTDVKELLNGSQPDVVHITTPPQSHYSLGKLCLEAGCHIYIEKPFTLDALEAEQLIKIAEELNRKVTVGHNLQFSHAAIRMRRLIRSGYLGGDPVHMEGIYCYDFGDARYAKAMLGDKKHWVRKLPGKLLHNIINHGVCKIAEFMKNPSPKVMAYGYISPLLQSIGETDIVDELRVIIHDDDAASAYFTFSSQIAPKCRQFRIHGPQNALYVDDDHQTVVKYQGAKYKSYLDQFIPPIKFAGQYLSNAMDNAAKFIRADFHMNYGMKQLIRRFYDSIENGGSPPIPYREIILTTKIMDEIFRQLDQK
jgi:predicted dehydrogenase